VTANGRAARTEQPWAEAATAARTVSETGAPQPVRELRLAVSLVGEFGQYVGCILAAAGGQATKFLDISLFAGQLDKLIDGVLAAAISEAAQLVHVATRTGQLDKLIDGVLAAAISEAAQLVHVATRTGQLDKLIDRVLAAAISEAAQLVHVAAGSRLFYELVERALISTCGRTRRRDGFVVGHTLSLRRPRPGRVVEGVSNALRQPVRGVDGWYRGSVCTSGRMPADTGSAHVAAGADERGDTVYRWCKGGVHHGEGPTVA